MIFFVLAVQSGKIEILKWLHEHGYPWNEDVCAEAAECCNLRTLMWLREKGCRWNGKTLALARDNGLEDVYEWAKMNGCPESIP